MKLTAQQAANAIAFIKARNDALDAGARLGASMKAGTPEKLALAGPMLVFGHAAGGVFDAMRANFPQLAAGLDGLNDLPPELEALVADYVQQRDGGPLQS